MVDGTCSYEEILQRFTNLPESNESLSLRIFMALIIIMVIACGGWDAGLELGQPLYL
jgi:hypothetical protein